MKQLSQEKLAELLKIQRKKLRLTQEELCDITDINRTMIGRIERKDYIPSIPQLERLADALQFDIEQVFIENRPTVFTAFRGANLTKQEQDGVEHLLEMMLVAKQQIMLRKALHHE